jgi:hypothetical protein
MYLSKTIIRVSVFMPILIFFGILLLLAISYANFGYFPQYGIDKDPGTIFPDGFIKVKNFSLIASFYLLIGSFLSLIAILITRIYKLSRKEKIIAIGIYALGLLILMLLKESSSFKWLID